MPNQTEHTVQGDKGTMRACHNYQNGTRITKERATTDAVYIRTDRYQFGVHEKASVTLSTKQAYDLAVDLLAIVGEVHEDLAAGIASDFASTLGFKPGELGS